MRPLNGLQGRDGPIAADASTDTVHPETQSPLEQTRAQRQRDTHAAATAADAPGHDCNARGTGSCVPECAELWSLRTDCAWFSAFASVLTATPCSCHDTALLVLLSRQLWC